MFLQRPAQQLATEIWNTLTTRERILLSISSVACGVLLTWMSRTMGVPSEPGFTGSLLRDQYGFVGMVILGLGIIGCTGVACILVGRARHEAGLFCACIGLAFLSVRVGGIKPALQDSSASVFMLLAVETAGIFLFLGFAWLVVELFTRLGWTTNDPVLEGDADVPLANKIFATVTTAAIIVVVTSLLAQTDDKGQIISAVCIASCVGAIGGHSLFPTRGSIWFWSAPLLAAIFGYAYAAYVSQPVVYLTGSAPTNLCRALPLDFASVGVAGAMYGYWMARRWKHTDDDQDTSEIAISPSAAN